MTRSVLLIAINSGVAISGTPPPILLGVPYSYTLTAIGIAGGCTFTQTGLLPTGITFTDNGNGTATIAGTTTAATSYPITVTVTPTGGVAVPFSYTLQVLALTLQFFQPVPITRGVAIGAGIEAQANGGTGTGYAYSATGLPAGLSISSTTGVVTGTVTAAVGTYSVTFHVTDSGTNTSSVTTTIVVNSRLTAPFAPAPVGGSTVVKISGNYENQIAIASFDLKTLIGGYTGTLSFTTASNSGLAINASGILSGTPVIFAGSGTLGMGTTVTDSGTGDTLLVSPNIFIAEKLRMDGGVNMPANVYVTVPFSGFRTFQTLSKKGFGPYTFSDVGMPAWITVTHDASSGLSTYTGTAPTSYTQAQTAVSWPAVTTDSLGATWTDTISLTVNQPAALQPQKNASNVGATGPLFINFSFTATGADDVTNDGTTVTVTLASRNTTTTSGTFVVAAVNSTQVVNVAASRGFLVGDFVNVSDGSHTITGAVTAVGSSTQITVKTLVISAGATGNTMATGAVVKPDAMPKATSTIDGYLSATDFATFNGKQAAFGSQAANLFYASPDGSAGLPSFRGIFGNDLPTIYTKHQAFNIGLSSWAAASSTCFVLEGTGAAFGCISSQPLMMQNAIWGGSTWTYKANGAAANLFVNAGTLNFQTAAAGTAGAVASMANVFTVSNVGVAAANGIKGNSWADSYATSGGQGAYFGWNRTGGTGETDFVNHHGGGGGAWYWIDTNGSTFTISATLDSQGQFKAANYGSALVDKGVVGASVALNFQTGDHQAFQTTSATACTVSWTLPSNPCRFAVRVKAPATGTSPAVTWPAMKGTAPTAYTLNTQSMLWFEYDGANVFYMGGCLNV
jgi:hypothetical protein